MLRGMNSETIDLIATDPPFNTKRNRAGSAGFYVDKWKWGDTGILPDQWKWNEVHPIWLDQIKDQNKGLHEVIQATRTCQGEDIAAFICFLSVRLLEMHRLLKPTGNIFLHCDHTANGYIRMAMDAIFGAGNFRNEIAWLRKSEKHNLASKRFPQSHDTILYYSKNLMAGGHNVQMTEYSPEHVATHYKHSDGRGRYATYPCTNESGGNRPYEFRGITRAWRFAPEKMDSMFKADMLTQSTPTSPFRYKKYLTDARGVKVSDLWTDVTRFEKDEKTGSPDQKPLKAYKRMILAGSNEGDLVLDPFAGCATTIVAARDLGRRWVGVDRRADARFHVVCRLAGIRKKDADNIRERQNLAEWLDDQLAKYDAHYATTAPDRTDDRDTAAPYLEPVYTSHDRSVFTHKEMHGILIERFGPICWGCDFDGSIYEERGPRYLELDHVNPKSSGGHDHLDNRALLCGPCNREKSDRQTLIQLRRSTMGVSRARNHRINLENASAWCRARLAQEHVARAKT